MADETTGWTALGPASIEYEGEQPIKFMARGRLTMNGSIRRVERKIPWRKGAKQDDTGANADDLNIEAPFFNTVTEPDMGDWPPMWPDRLNKLVDLFKTCKTCTLHLPWRRNIRCKADSWQRVADIENEVDGETLTVKFAEDNEDSLDGPSAEDVSVRANIMRVVEQATFDLESEGMWDGSFEDLTQFAADLEGALNAPGEFLWDIAHKARRVRRAARAIRESFTSRLSGRRQMDDPTGERAYRDMLSIEDKAARAEAEALASLPPTTTRTFDTDRDIHSIAAELGQNARDLMSLNGHIEDLGFIEAGTPVVVFAG
jgi:hypothetical protein